MEDVTSEQDNQMDNMSMEEQEDQMDNMPMGMFNTTFFVVSFSNSSKELHHDSTSKCLLVCCANKNLEFFRCKRHFSSKNTYDFNCSLSSLFFPNIQKQC